MIGEVYKDACRLVSPAFRTKPARAREQKAEESGSMAGLFRDVTAEGFPGSRVMRRKMSYVAAREPNRLSEMSDDIV